VNIAAGWLLHGVSLRLSLSYYCSTGEMLKGPLPVTSAVFSLVVPCLRMPEQRGQNSRHHIAAGARKGPSNAPVEWAWLTHKPNVALRVTTSIGLLRGTLLSPPNMSKSWPKPRTRWSSLGRPGSAIAGTPPVEEPRYLLLLPDRSVESVLDNTACWQLARSR
jgi:hypothetical protein